jgi:hypothetical protein
MRGRSASAILLAGGVFTLNPDPEIPTTPDHPFNKAMAMRQTIEDAFKKNLPVSRTNSPDAGLDGVYLDSLEMSSGQLNYRREHSGTTRVPLVFDHEGRPCQLMIFNTWSFERDIASQMHARGKLLFANDVLWQFSFPAPLLDVLGTEVNWLRHREYQPDSDAVMNFRRALCRQKPYCLLMNTDFSQFTPDRVERYFERCLFYGVWPGFFDEEVASKDPYWASAKQWYERDRPLFKRYIPVLRRLTAAGWEQVTYARSSNPNICVERFGPDHRGDVFLTVLNDTADPQSGTLVVELKALGLKGRVSASELVSRSVVTPAGGGWPISLQPQEAKVLCLSRGPQ